MKRPRSPHPLSLLLALLCLLSLALSAYPTVTTMAESGSAEAAVARIRAEDAVKGAWERAHEAGSYRYTADIVQTTIPRPTVTNIGRTSLQDALHVEGETNLPDRTMHMVLWSQGGSVQHAETGAEMRVEGDRAFVRKEPAGGGDESWEEVEDFGGGLFGSGSDPMAFLAAAKDITDQGTDTRPIPDLQGDRGLHAISFTRYTFRVDGHSYAVYVRDQIEQHLAEKGELPPGVTLDLPRQYANMTGEGELWIDDDGLPLRQIIHLEFPPRPDDHRIEADITVTFADFGFGQQVVENEGTVGQGDEETRQQGALASSLRSLVGDHAGRMLQQTALFTSVLTLIGLAALNGRSKKLYAALTLVIIVSMVFTPVLQSVRAADFVERYAARAAEQPQPAADERRTANDESSPNEPLPSVHRPPSIVQSPLSLPQQTGDDSTDTDNDGLTDYQESLLGTNPEDADSDGDLITDTLEVQGFEYFTLTWTLDPLEIDTNGDTIDDWRECPDAPVCLDTDGDGTPDLFDRDNDGDGVPDELDASPFTKGSAVFTQTTPLSLILNDLTPDKPTYVEFQLRPADADHLWYAFNVLDWPTGDVEGQVQDADGRTFYQEDPDSLPVSPNNNGDLKLIPMLEIRTLGEADNLPSQAELESYDILVRNLQPDGDEKALYVPLRLVGDSLSGERVAFSGKMLYRPGTSWGNAQEVRLAWVVQALVDVCREVQDGECVDYDYNQVQVVHTYYDDWTLTGLNITENHGVDVALIYEDPAEDGDLTDDDALVALADGLDATFLAARAGADDRRDVTVAEIYDRFNHSTNAVTDEQRWNIPDVLGVVTRTYEHRDTALIHVTMTDTKTILDSVFTPHWLVGAAITPTLMFAREEHQRSTNLDVQGSGNTVTWSGEQLTIDLPPSGDDGLLVQTIAGVQWAPYCYDGVAWDTCPTSEYVHGLPNRYPFAGEDDAQATAGLQLGTQMYYMALYAGATGVVQMGDNVWQSDDARSDQSLAAKFAAAQASAGGDTKPGEAVIRAVYDPLQEINPDTMEDFWQDLGNLALAVGLTAGGTLKPPAQWPTRLASELDWLKWDGAGGSALSSAVFAISFTTDPVNLDHPSWSDGAPETFFDHSVFKTSMASFNAAKSVLDLGASLAGIGKIANFLKLTDSIKKSVDTFGKASAVVGLVLDLGLTWAPFFLQTSGMDAFSPQFNMLLAKAIASTIVAIILFALSMDPSGIGGLIVAIFSLIDALVELIFGFSIKGWLIETLAKMIYTFEVTVDFDPDIGPLDTGLDQPMLGLSAGNVLDAATNVTTTITHIGPDNWRLYLYRPVFYNTGKLRSTTVRHTLTPDEQEVPVGRGQMRYDWNVTRLGSYRYQGVAHSGNLVTRSPLRTGINQHMLFLNTGYALPAVECWTIWILAGFIPIPIPVCYDRSWSGHDSTDMDVVFDVFPATLNEFYAPTTTGNGGYRLGWDDDFQTLMDADGDGLLSPARGGPDPDDTKWDTDGDGLCDAYELQLRETGVPADPEDPDTDDDGLCDGEEARLGTDLANTDTDNDGLADGLEVFHQDCATAAWEGGWTFDVDGLVTRVTSDPLSRDGDGDGINDLAEYTLRSPYHPRVWNESPVGLYTELGDDDSFVHPSQTLAYTATARNNFEEPLYTHGDLVVGFPEVLDVDRNMHTDGPVRAVAVDGDDVYVGGQFTVAGGVNANNIALWNRNTEAWSPLGNGLPPGGEITDPHVGAIAVTENGDVIVGGRFDLQVEPGGPTAWGLVTWNGTHWEMFGDGGFVGTAEAVALDANGNVYVGGYFDGVSGQPASDIAMWNSSSESWDTLGGGVGGVSPWLSYVSAIAIDDNGDVYVGGYFTQAGGVPANSIAKWDSSSGTWSSLGDGVNGAVNAITISGDDVYVGGEFAAAGTLPVNNIARWNSTIGWSGLGDGVTGTVSALAVNEIGDLYAGGQFAAAGGVSAANAARWTGTAWEPLGNGVDNGADAIAVDGSQVYVGGGFMNHLAGWNDLLERWVWPNQLFFTLFRGEQASIARTLTAASGAETQVAPIDNAQRSQFNDTGYAGSWDWDGRWESVRQLDAGQHPWHTAVAPLPGSEGYRVAALTGDAMDTGHALRLDGVDDHVDLPDNFPDAIDFTFSAWVYWQGGGAWQRIFDFGQDTNTYMFLTPSNNEAYMRFAITNGGNTVEQRLSTESLPTNQWVHIAVTLEGDIGTLYVNGIAVDSQTITLNPEDVVGGNTWLGRSQYPADPYFSGLIDEVRIWDVARTQTDIRVDMNRELTGTLPGELVAYWPLDEGSGATAHDQTANGNDGTLFGPTWDDTSAPFLNKGHIVVHTANENGFSGTPVTVDDGVYAKHAAPPDVACADDGPGGSAGPCLAVWSEEHGDSFDVYGAIVAPDLSAGAPFSITSGVDSVMPAVASDGTDFLAAWERPAADAGYSLRFDGVDDLVHVPTTDTLDIVDDISVMAWIKQTGDGTSGAVDTIASKWDAGATSWSFTLTRDSEKLRVLFNISGSGESEYLSYASIPENQWVHVAFTKSGDVLRFFINGDLDSQVTLPGTVLQSVSTPVRIGAEAGGSHNFTGLIDEVRVWNLACTQDQIQTDMNRALAGDEPGLAGYWRFNEGSGGTATDQTANGNDGTLVNGPTWDPDNGQIRTRLILHTGGLSGVERWLHAGKDDRYVDLAWAGDRYIAAWENANNGGDVWTAYVNADGTYEPGSAQAVAATSAREERPQVAYNPDIGKAMVAYRTNGDDMHGKLVQGYNVSNAFDVGSRGTDSDLDYPRVAYDPVHASWLGAWSARTGDGRSAVNFQALRGDEPGPALSFDGVDDYVSISDDSSIDFAAGQDFTAELWAKPASEQQDIQLIDNSILEKWSGGGGYPYVIRYLNRTAGSDPGKVAVGRYDGVNNPAIASSRTINDGQFHHIAFVKDGGTLYLYIDGVLDGTTPDTITGDTTNGSPLFLGQRGPNTNRFTGLIDEVRIWNVARMQAQIQADMNRTLTGDEPGLVAYWRFDEGWGNTAHDQTANDNHGALFGPTWTTGHAPFPDAIYAAGSRQQYTWPSELSPQGSSLACTRALGPRMLWLRFDEAPGATTFADDSGHGNVGSCSGATCPDAGVVGQVGAGLCFDGVDDQVQVPPSAGLDPEDELTLAAWVNIRPSVDHTIVNKTGVGNGYYLGVSDSDLYLEIWDSAGHMYAATWGIIPTSTWTHLAVTWRSGGDMIGYINGQEAGRISASADPIGPTVNPLYIGPLSGLLDEVIIFGRALSAQQIEVLYNGSYDAACALTTDDAPWAEDPYRNLYYNRLNLRWPTRWMGVVESPDPVVVPVTIDADPPTTSTVTSLADGQYVQGAGQTLIIGGIAEDLTSGIATVEISINGGAWEVVSGTESWAYDWQVPVTAGAYTLRTRATDAVGHVFTETAGITVFVDIYRPDVTYSISSGDIITASQNAEERWIVPLDGTVEDRLDFGGPPGSGVASVEVMLEGSGSVAGQGWQATTLTSPGSQASSWSLDYVLPLHNNDRDSMPDPTGEYTFLVRATDNVGNRTASFTGIPLRIDNTAPVADITYTGPSTNVITQTLALGGVITDPGVVARGVAGLEIAYTPVELINSYPISELLPLMSWLTATVVGPGVGVTRTTWTHTVPGSADGLDPNGLEGIYQIDLRGTDMMGNRNDDMQSWGQWRGEIDTLAPRVHVDFWQAGTSDTARTQYTCQAEDFRLDEDTFQCPCPALPTDRHYYDTPWWRTWVSDTTQLYRIETSCIVPGHQSASTAFVDACDLSGRCNHDDPDALLYAVESITSPLDSVIFTPTYGTVLTATDPISVAGGVYAERTLGLKALTVTVDATAVIYTKTWATGTSWGETWSTTWPSLTEGPHTLLSVAADHHTYVQTDTHPITVVVDTLPPEIAVPAAVLTTAHRLSYGRVALTGPYTETGGVDAIRVRAEAPGSSGSPWGDAAAINSTDWRYAWYLDEEPDGKTYTVTAVITDVVGRSDQGTSTVVVDLVGPAPVTVTLAYTDSQGALAGLVPGQTIRDVLSPTLIIIWTASSSPDLSHYYAGWTSEEVEQVSNLSYYALTRRHEQQVGEAQMFYAHVVAQDTLGNRQWHTLGPIYTDITTTPDYVTDRAYHGWTESGCTQIGADRELVRNAYRGQALTNTQRLYATWDNDALRLTWTGANWGDPSLESPGDGDLFVYLDTGEPGGATVAYNPYTATTGVIGLPAQGSHQLEADYLIWVEDTATAELRCWNGSDWVISTTLSSNQYELDTTASPPATDLTIPFDLLGISNPATAALKLVALASEEDALRVWAAMPEKNALNSERVVNTPGVTDASQHFTLTQQYEWTSLGAGLCPSEGQFTDADLLVDISADPPGVEVGYLEHDLLYLTPGAPLDADLDGEPDVALPLDTFPDLVGQGQVITYAVHYANEGTEAAPGVCVTVTAQGALQLASDPLVLGPIDVGAGNGTTIEFTGTVDTSIYTQSVEVDVVVADGIHGPFDWLWIQHDVDTVAPEDVEIVAPLRYIKPFTNTVRGTVYDPSGVPAIRLETQPVPAGAPSYVLCTDPTPDDGQWACAWNVGDVDNGDQFRLRAQATDRFGNTGGWSEPVTLTVDALAPTIILDPEAEAHLPGAVLGPDDSILLTGRVEDDQQAKGAQICFALAYGQSCEDINVYPGSGITGTWSYGLRAVGELDNELQEFSLYGVDGAGNRSAPLDRAYGVDTVPPVVTVTLQVDYLPTTTPTPVLGGTVSDGGGVSEMYVSVETPEGDTSWDPVAPVGNTWSYTLNPDTAGMYTLWIQARDPKGNTSEEGPFRVFVGVKMVYLPLVLRNH